MATNLQVANRAIREVGGQPIDDLSDARSATSRIVNDALISSIEEVLSSFDWYINQATEQSTGLLGGLPGSAYTYTHDLSLTGDLTQPMDRVLSVSDATGAQIYEYNISGQSLYTSEEVTFIRYTFPMSDVETFPAFLVAVIAAHLAKEICLPLSGNQERRTILEQDYISVLQQAKVLAAAQNPQQSFVDDASLRTLEKLRYLDPMAQQGRQERS